MIQSALGMDHLMAVVVIFEGLHFLEQEVIHEREGEVQAIRL